MQTSAAPPVAHLERWQVCVCEQLGAGCAGGAATPGSRRHIAQAVERHLGQLLVPLYGLVRTRKCAQPLCCHLCGCIVW